MEEERNKKESSNKAVNALYVIEFDFVGGGGLQRITHSTLLPFLN